MTEGPIYRLGLLGHPVAHSLSPKLHNAALQHFHLAGSYDLFDVEACDVEARLRQLAASGYVGLNVTVPHKQQVFSLSDELTNEAEQAGAVNCLKIVDGKIIGHNTDIEGFQQSLADFLKNHHHQLDATAVVIGAGGASRAALWGLAKLGFQNILLIARNQMKAQSLLDELTAKGLANISYAAVDNLDFVDRNISLIVNATGIGMQDKNLPDWLLRFFANCPEKTLFFDMVYKMPPAKTAMLAAAETFNMESIDGMDMLVVQALLSFQFWTAKLCPKGIMREALVR